MHSTIPIEPKDLGLKAAAIGCAVPIVLAAALTKVTYDLLEPSLDLLEPPLPRLRLGFAIASAICFALALTSVSSLVWYGRGAGSRASVRRRTRAGETPGDGEPMLATGVVRALTAPLAAPLSGRPCVAYEYRMHGGLIRDGGTDIAPVYWGYASRPFALDGPTRGVRVLAVPRLECPVSHEESDEAVARAREFVRRTTFEPTSALPLDMLGTVFEQVREMITDEDGEVRRDRKREGPDVDPGELILEESILPIGVEASVHGPWSSSRGAIVAPGTLAASTHVVAVLGRADAQLAKLAVAHSTTSYLVTAALLAALGAGLVWFANILPSLL